MKRKKKIKNNMKRVIVVALSIFFIASICLLIFKRECTPPSRPPNVPRKALWKGGCDGGNWIELLGITENRYRFKIYRDLDGVLELDADFIFKTRECSPEVLTNVNWGDEVQYYQSGIDSLEYIILRGQHNGKTCILQSIYPAYGGETWDVIREKYKIN